MPAIEEAYQWVAGGGALLMSVLWAVAQHTVRNYAREVRDLRRDYGELLTQSQLQKRDLKTVDDAAERNKTLLCQLQTELHQWALAITKLQALGQLPDEIKCMRTTQEQHGAQLARIEEQLKRSSGQHPVRR